MDLNDKKRRKIVDQKDNLSNEEVEKINSYLKAQARLIIDLFNELENEKKECI